MVTFTDSGATSLAAVVADTTDGPVWALVAVTFLLFVATAVLAYAAFKALGAIREATQDRHVEFFAEMGRRWQSDEMVDALQIQKGYTPEELNALFEREGEQPSNNPLIEARRRRDIRERIVLLRVPNYFEDAVIAYKAGGLDGDLFAENFGGVAIEMWKAWAVTVESMQKRIDELTYSEFQKFALQISAEDQARQEEKEQAEAEEKEKLFRNAKLGR
jgi:hypothetical protein